MTTPTLSANIDAENYKFITSIKERLLPALPTLSDEKLEWLIMEHYQFSKANVDLLNAAVRSTAKLADKRATVELQRNVEEEDGHAPMYRQGMLNVGTEMDLRTEFSPTTLFLEEMRELASSSPSFSLGALYASETAAIFEHEVFNQICEQVVRHRGHVYQGSLIKKFHDIHLDEGIEQGHKDGLSSIIDAREVIASDIGDEVKEVELYQGALKSIQYMQTWWEALLDVLFSGASAAGSLVPAAAYSGTY